MSQQSEQLLWFYQDLTAVYKFALTAQNVLLSRTDLGFEATIALKMLYVSGYDAKEHSVLDGCQY